MRLKDINGELGEDMQLFEPSIDEKIEYPEKFFEVNDSEIEQYRKLKLEREREAAQSKKKNMMGKK